MTGNPSKQRRCTASKKVLLIALGGNALIRKGQAGTVAEQFENLKSPMRQIARLSKEYRIVITHGNGPQVGNLLLQQESVKGLPKLPLEILVAQTQGQIGYMIESTLDTQFMRLQIANPPCIVTLISYVVVDEQDPAFQTPTKPIGPIYPSLKEVPQGYDVRNTAKGYRRVVVSPKPVTIVEKKEIKRLIESDFIVICCGGGGIPVVREGRSFCGVNAVIDKDLASAQLAQEIGVDIFVIVTDVPGVARAYGTPAQKFIKRLTPEDAARMAADGELPLGSMAPKVTACLNFIAGKGRTAIITSLDAIETAINGNAGTRFA